MRVLIIFLLLGSYTAIGQSPLFPNNLSQKSDINLKGNENIIKVIQGNIVKVYNITDDTQAQKFLDYLKTIPTINKQILNYSKRTFELVTKINERTNNAGVFNIREFVKELESYIRDNERLRIENEKLRKQTTDPNFATALEEANKRLAGYDNEGYQQILENYKIEKKNKINKEQRELSQASYLQAQNNYFNYKLELSLNHINEALEYDNNDVDYLFFKAKILFELFKYDESINTFLKVSAFSTNDTLRSESYNYIGLIYDSKGNYDESLRYTYKAIGIREKILGKEHLSIALSYNNIGFVYYHKGNFNKALEFYSKALTIQKKVGTEFSNIATSYNNLGLVYDEKGEYDTALMYYKKVLDIQSKNIGKEDLRIAYSYNNIGAVYYHQKNYNKTLKYYFDALTILEKVLGKENPTTAMTYNNIASVYEYKTEYEIALSYRRKALAIFEKVLGEEHVYTSNAYNNIGATYDAKGNPDSALEYYTKALLIQEKILDKENPITATSYNNIGLIYYEKGNYSKAIEYYYKALIIWGKVYGSEHDKTQQVNQKLGLAFIAKGEKEKGVSYLEKSIFSKFQIFDKVNILNNWAVPMLKEGKCTEAASFLDIALEFLQNNNFNKRNSLWIVIYRNIGMAYCCKGDKKKSLPLFEKAILLCTENKEEKIDVNYIKELYERCKIR